jgi:hypothetical protein
MSFALETPSHAWVDAAAVIGAIGALIVATTGMLALFVRTNETHRKLDHATDRLTEVYNTVNSVEHDVDGVSEPGEPPITLGQRTRRLEQSVVAGFAENGRQHEEMVEKLQRHIQGTEEKFVNIYDQLE